MPKLRLVPRATGHNRSVGDLATAELQRPDGYPIAIIPIEMLWDVSDSTIYDLLFDSKPVTVELTLTDD